MRKDADRMKKFARRDFMKATGAIGGFLILPSGLRANPPSSRLAYAIAGCGGNGGNMTRTMISHSKLELVACCDPDQNQIAGCSQ